MRQAALQLQHLGMESGQKRPAQDDDEDNNVVEEVPQPSRQSRGVAEQRVGPAARASVGSSASTQAQITSYTQVLKHADAQEAIASFLYECGIPFNVTRHPA